MTLRRQTLPPIDAALVRMKKWASITDPQEALLIAEAWQADHDAGEIADEIGRSMYVVRSAIAGMRMAGVLLRPSMETYQKRMRDRLERGSTRLGQQFKTAEREVRYFALRDALHSPVRCGQLMDISQALVDKLEGLFRATRFHGAITPLFADYDAHVAAVLAQGGFHALDYATGCWRAA